MLKIPISIVAIWISSLFTFFSCASSVFRSVENPEKSISLTQKAIFTYLEQPNSLLATLTGKGPIRIDPKVCGKERLIVNRKTYFDEPMRTDILGHSRPQKGFRLSIPDSLAKKYGYTDECDEDYERDYAIIHQFSPLLPTIELNVYLIEHYIWGNACQETGCVRLLMRHYLKFKIERKTIISIDVLGLKNLTDFIGLGSFNRKKMEEALPGEKIAEFGW